MSGFASINESVNEQLDAREAGNGSSQESIENNKQNETQSEQAPQQEASNKEVQDAITELERIEKFKFQGKEYTPKELGTLLKREQEAQRAFTQKTQALAEERRIFQEERKFYDNLNIDLEAVKKNPSLAQEFLNVYPEKFHSRLKDILGSTSQSQNQQQQTQSTSQIPFELMNDVHMLKQQFQKQEVAKAEVQIENDLKNAMADFKYASKKEVLADIFEFHNQQEVDPATGRKPPIPSEIWKQAAEASHNSRKLEFDEYQKELIKQQKQANAKARDVGAGGGTPGQAPKKFDPKRGFKGLNQDVLESLNRTGQ